MLYRYPNWIASWRLRSACLKWFADAAYDTYEANAIRSTQLSTLNSVAMLRVLVGEDTLEDVRGGIVDEGLLQMQQGHVANLLVAVGISSMADRSGGR